MKNMILTSLIIFLWGGLVGQWQAVEEWSRRYNGPGNGIDLLSTMTLDSVGNVYVTGRSSGIGTGQDYATLKYSPQGQSLLEMRYNASGTSFDAASDIVVDDLGNIHVTGTSSASGITTIKYDVFGDTLWTRSFNPPPGAQGFRITVDDSNNVYVGGNAGEGIAVIKYSRDGNELWSTFLVDSSSYDMSFVDFALDEQGNVSVTGNTTNQFSGEFLNDFITAKFNQDGIEEWRQYYSLASQTDDIPIGLEIDSQGNTIVGGASYECPNPYGICEDDYVVIKYSPTGVEKWVRIYESPLFDEDIPVDIAVDSQDNIIITGYSVRNVESFNFLTIKYDSSGNELWTSEYNGPGNKRDFAHALTLDTQDNIYITGSSRAGITADAELVSVKYDPNGSQVWAVSYSDAASSSNIGWSIAVDDENNVYVGAQSVGNSSSWDYLTVKYRQVITGVSNRKPYPDNFILYQNYPNPFNPNTTIAYQLNHPSPVLLQVFNSLGQQVGTLVNEIQSPGSHHIQFDGSNISSGMYYYRIEVNGFAHQKSMLLIK